MENEEKKSVWPKVLGIGCLLVILLVGAGGYLIYVKGKDFALSTISTVIKSAAEEMFISLNLPEADRDAAMVPIDAFAERIKNGEISLEQAAAVGQELAEGGVVALLVSRAFEVGYMEKSGLSSEEKLTGHITLTRYGEAVMKDQLSKAEIEQVTNVILEDVNGDGKNEQLKQTLTDDEIRECLALMKKSADDAGIEDREFTVDLPKAIQTAIDRGMKSAK